MDVCVSKAGSAESKIKQMNLRNSNLRKSFYPASLFPASFFPMQGNFEIHDSIGKHMARNTGNY